MAQRSELICVVFDLGRQIGASNIFEIMMQGSKRARPTGAALVYIQAKECRMSLEAESAFDLTFEVASIDEFDAVHRLLADNNLPVEDLKIHFSAFTVAKCESTLVGTVGLEIYGDLALVRSLCVADSHRSRRIGEALISAAAKRASAGGVRTLYLLTTNAARYFAALGFAPVERRDVPAPIQGTAQFSSLCPTSAVCMRKTV